MARNQNASTRAERVAGHVTLTLPSAVAAGMAAAPEEWGGHCNLKGEVVKDFLTDEAWADKPFWLLFALNVESPVETATFAAKHPASLMHILPMESGTLQFSAYARTVVGRIEYNFVAIVEYVSPVKFADSLSVYSKRIANEGQGAVAQLWVPFRPGWFHLDRPAPSPSRPFNHFDISNVLDVPNGMVKSDAKDVPECPTLASKGQVKAFVEDPILGNANALWHLNLLHFSQQGGRDSYRKYAKTMGGKRGLLPQFGARSTLSATCYRSLRGDCDFDEAIIAEYPCRDSFLSMGSCSEYLEVSPFRDRGLDETYIIACLPMYLDRRDLRPQGG